MSILIDSSPRRLPVEARAAGSDADGSAAARRTDSARVSMTSPPEASERMKSPSFSKRCATAAAPTGDALLKLVCSRNSRFTIDTITRSQRRHRHQARRTREGPDGFLEVDNWALVRKVVRDGRQQEIEQTETHAELVRKPLRKVITEVENST